MTKPPWKNTVTSLTKGDVFAEMIQHAIAVIVAFVVMVAYVLQNKIEDIETEMKVFNERKNAIETKCEKVLAKVEVMEIYMKDILDTKAMETDLMAKQESNHQRLISIEEEKLAIQKKHLEIEKGKMKLFDQYFHLRKKSYEDSKESRRGFFC